MRKIILKEQYGQESIKKVYLQTSGQKYKVQRSSKPWTSVAQSFKNVFLPQGYPDSVSEDYMTYQVWDTIQAFCSSITGALAAQAVLKGVGVGDEKATVLAATLTWLIKDGTGMVGRIMFAWMQGSYLDCDCKRWRLFADILNDCAIFMEILAPGFPHIFTPIVCIAGVCKSIVGVAGGATRAALTQHQARRNNLADVSAKDGSQETLVNLAALLCNLALIPYVTGHQTLIWSLFMVFTFLHLFANYNAVTSVTMSTINQARLHLIVKEYLASGNIPTIKSTNLREPVLWKTPWKISCYLGCSAQSAITTTDDLSHLKKIYSSGNYLLNVDGNLKNVYVMFSAQATHEDYLEAAVQFELLDFAVTNKGRLLGGPLLSDTHVRNLMDLAMKHDIQGLLSASHHWVKTHYAKLLGELKLTGWELDHVLFNVDEWRAEWRDSQLKNI